MCKHKCDIRLLICHKLAVHIGVMACMKYYTYPHCLCRCARDSCHLMVKGKFAEKAGNRTLLYNISHKLADRAQTTTYMWQDRLELQRLFQANIWVRGSNVIYYLCVYICVFAKVEQHDNLQLTFLGLTKRTTKRSFSDKRQINVKFTVW